MITLQHDYNKNKLSTGPGCFSHENPGRCGGGSAGVADRAMVPKCPTSRVKIENDIIISCTISLRIHNYRKDLK